MKKHISTFRMMLVVILLVGLFAFVGVASSHSPETAGPDAALAPDAPTSLLFSYQGQLLDTNGDPITNNALPITFRLFTVESGGTECWSESHSVDVEDGLFHVLLGQTSTIDPDCVAGDAFLELVVGEDIEAEVLIPREQLASVAYSALSADVSAPLDVDGRITSSGVGGGDLMALNPNNQNASVALSWMNDVARIRIGGTGTGAVGGLDIQTQGDNSLLRILHDGNVGIGTTSPGEKLDVIGNIDLHDHELRNVEEIRSDNDYVGFFKVATSGAEGIRVGDIGIDSSYTNANTNLASLGDNGLWVKGNTGVGGNVGIGTVNPSERLHVNGSVRGNQDGALRISSGHGYVDIGPKNTGFSHFATDRPAFYFDKGISVDTGQVSAYRNHLYLRTDSTTRIFADKDTGAIGIGTTNPQHGKVQINTNSVPLAFQESDQTGAGSLWRMPLDSKILRFDVSLNGTDWSSAKTPFAMYQSGEVSTGGNLNMGGDLNMNGHSVSNCGALTEANLQTPEELASERIDRFEEGDVLCWSTDPDQLERCAQSEDSLIMAVADSKGRPIVMGAEPIKVLGSVKVGDYLVASDVPGYAMATDSPAFGIVIAQALEDFDGDRGLIKAMIRKM